MVRFWARLTEPAHVASSADALISVMSTPEHGECSGFEGGGAVCREYYGGALKVQELWQAKARALNIPLSAKGHAVGQRGAFTGRAIDTYKGRFHMLPEKLASMVSARDDLAAAALSTPRIIARVGSPLRLVGSPLRLARLSTTVVQSRSLLSRLRLSRS